MTDNVTRCLERHNINSVLIPASCTGKFQPMDILVNRAAKAFLEREFQDWYAKEVMKQIRTGDKLAPVYLNSVEMKHLSAKWIVKMFEHISNNPHHVLNKFIASGFTNTVSNALKDIETDEEYDMTSDERDVTGSDNVDGVFSSDVDTSL